MNILLERRKMKMNIKLEVYDALCETAVFEINGIKADYGDFGDKYDTDPENAYEYCCGNMQFIPQPATQEILDKYKITLEEYNEICKMLDALSFGECGWCS